MFAGDRNAEELNYTHVVTPANHRQPLSQLRQLYQLPELALENDNVFAADGAVPRRRGGGGVAFGEEVVGGGANFGELVNVRPFGQRIAEAGQRGSAREGGGCSGGFEFEAGSGGGVAGAGGVAGGGIRNRRRRFWSGWL